MSFAREFSELLRRDLTRLIQQLEGFPTTEALWQTAPGITNSAGNLTLHLEGNLREFIGRQLGNLPYVRQRDLEFSSTGLSAADLIQRVEALRDSIPQAAANLTEQQLDADFPQNVLGAPMSSRKFLIHLLGHFDYHLGQIDYLRRVVTGNGAVAQARV